MPVSRAFPPHHHKRRQFLVPGMYQVRRHASQKLAEKNTKNVVVSQPLPDKPATRETTRPVAARPAIDFSRAACVGVGRKIYDMQMWLVSTGGFT